ncbi:MAG: nucleotidyltransferase domain-containing protein [Candidatus Thorarchaeota archaeon]
MKKEKILRDHFEKIIYSKKDWNLLQEKRKHAIKLLDIFVKEGFNPYIHGSIARGDTHESSDIDLVFFRQVPSFQIELILDKNGYKNYFREIIMATPSDSIKLYIHLSEIECITLPLSKPERKTMEFYDFGGKLDIHQLKMGVRVPGIDKRLVLIKPISEGHEEFSIIGNEANTAKDVGISVDTINERVQVLLRREKYGKTGVFLKRQIHMNETTEEVLKKMAKRKSIIRKKLLKK